jgi:hypothetical protein
MCVVADERPNGSVAEKCLVVLDINAVVNGSSLTTGNSLMPIGQSMLSEAS